MRWGGYVAPMGKKSECMQSLGENLKEMGHDEDLDVNGRIILKWILEE
jgi:hypothetical protein